VKNFNDAIRYSFIFCIALGMQLLSAMTNYELFENKNIVILGGTGYLGRAIAAEMLKYNPARVVIYSRDEVKHFNMTKIFGHHANIKHVIGDIRDFSSLLQATRGADIVFHVAALKRMDALESNVEEAIKTDVIGSINVFNACVENNVDKVLFISTDKSCSPINTYGACKFVSEKIFTNYDTTQIKTKFIATRFGNILQSTGSVIPIFTDKIKNGEDIPLTDDRMTRFIVDKQEATELIFDALRYGNGGEIFVKRLPALKVTDLIHVLKDRYNATNKIKVIGLRPGEKIHEVLINESEMARTIEFNGLFIIRPSVADLYKNDHEVPLYMQKGKRANTSHQDFVTEYSSGQAVIDKGPLAELFEKLGLL